MTEPCPTCESLTSNRVIQTREMMFGSRRSFRYELCDSCGCLWLVDRPADMTPYYPSNYYSYDSPGGRGLFRRALRRARARRVIEGRGWLGAWLVLVAGVPPGLGDALRCGASLDARILEVGCGGGEWLLAMHDCGFRRLRGIDPYASAASCPVPGVMVDRLALEEAEGEYDMIVANHVFEHFADPVSAARALRRLTVPGGTIVVRMPLASSYAFRTYREHWVQLDAPRHLVVQTQKSFEQLVERAGLRVADVVYDATAFQFWGSEQYRRGIALRDSRSYAVSPRRSPFGRREIRGFERHAAILNRIADGDQATFFIRA